MINANELRIGNYLRIHGDPAPIQIGWFYLIAKGEELPPHEPIPLTPEILERAGFSIDIYKGEDHDVYTYSDEKITFDSNSHYGYQLLDNEQTPLVDGYYFKYLHQLQNIYFALTGEELAIEL